jgi:hypothetical protein
MLDQNTLLIVLIAFTISAVCFLYYFLFQTAISSALKEHQGERFFNRWILVTIILVILTAYGFMARPFTATNRPSSYEASPVVQFFMICAICYVVLEIPYQLVKMAAKTMADEVLAAGDDKREVARLKSAQTLASIIHEKLNVTCELQAYSSNDEFIFLTYIVNNRPVATRLKISQADKAESWKKLGEWLIQGYQKEV